MERIKNGFQPKESLEDESVTVDVVKVVRCSNCVDWNGDRHLCKYFNRITGAYDYCSKGMVK